MLSDLVASSLEPELLKILHAADAALGGVQTRLEAQKAGSDQLASLSAEMQLQALAAWRPVLMDIAAFLSKPAAAPHTPSPLGHGH